jgi:diguanylate cyclase
MQPAFETDQSPIELETTCGIAIFPEHAEQGILLLQRAELALTAAKERGDPFGIYRADNDNHTRRRLLMFGMLRAGLQRDELTLHYQPKIALADGQLVGAEALVRWRSPELGLVSPAEFIPLAEQTSLIKPLTAWVLREAFRQVAAWQEHGLQVHLAINLSARNLTDETLPSQVAALLEASGVSADLFTMEVTESAVMANAQRGMQVLARLRELGLRLSIDDFGTGYGSLTYLRTVPAAELKIDRSFVLDIENNASNAAIVGAVIDLAHGLGLTVVAEGVETLAALLLLRQLNCDMMQGYFLSHPLPALEFSRFVAAYPSGPFARQLREARAAGSAPPETGIRSVGQTARPELPTQDLVGKPGW